MPIEVHIADFLTDLHNANTLANTIRAYRGDLTAFAEHVDGDLAVMGVDPVRAFLSEISDLAPTTRKRKRSAFCRWAVRYDRMPANPMDKVGTITVPKRLPRRRRPPTSTASSTRSARAGPARPCRSVYCATGCCPTGCCSKPPTSVRYPRHRGLRPLPPGLRSVPR